MHPVDTKVAILNVAARLYADRGYSAVSMRDVANGVGVTQANLYYHFKDKDDLIRETLAHVFAEKTGPMAELLEKAETRDARLEIFVDYFVRLLMKDRVFFRLFVRELVDGDSARLRALAHSVLEHPFRLVMDLADPRQPEDERFLTAVSIISIALGHVQLAVLLPYLPGGRPEHTDPTIIVRHVTAVLLRAFYGAEKEK
jgi:AcrR family transcriptional regulator